MRRSTDKRCRSTDKRRSGSRGEKEKESKVRTEKDIQEIPKEIEITEVREIPKEPEPEIIEERPIIEAVTPMTERPIIEAVTPMTGFKNLDPLDTRSINQIHADILYTKALAANQLSSIEFTSKVWRTWGCAKFPRCVVLPILPEKEDLQRVCQMTGHYSERLKVLLQRYFLPLYKLYQEKVMRHLLPPLFNSNLKIKQRLFKLKVLLISSVIGICNNKEGLYLPYFGNIDSLPTSCQILDNADYFATVFTGEFVRPEVEGHFLTQREFWQQEVPDFHGVPEVANIQDTEIEIMEINTSEMETVGDIVGDKTKEAKDTTDKLEMPDFSVPPPGYPVPVSFALPLPSSLGIASVAGPSSTNLLPTNSSLSLPVPSKDSSVGFPQDIVVHVIPSSGYVTPVTPVDPYVTPAITNDPFYPVFPKKFQGNFSKKKKVQKLLFENKQYKESSKIMEEKLRDSEMKNMESQSKMLSLVQLINRYEGLRIKLLNHCKMMEILVPNQLKDSNNMIPPGLEIQPLENETIQRLLEPFEYIPQIPFPAVDRGPRSESFENVSEEESDGLPNIPANVKLMDDQLEPLETQAGELIDDSILDDVDE